MCAGDILGGEWHLEDKVSGVNEGYILSEHSPAAVDFSVYRSRDVVVFSTAAWIRSALDSCGPAAMKDIPFEILHGWETFSLDIAFGVLMILGLQWSRYG